MIKKVFLPLLIMLILFAGCSVSNKNYNPSKKYSRIQLQQDYSLLRNILETKHPSLYWYTSKDSMNFYFDSLYNNIADSMTELQFGWNVLAPLTQKIHCGHTSFSMSSHWNKYIKNKIIPSFPLYLRVWSGDTMVVVFNLNKKDSLIKKGMLVTSINGLNNHEIVQKLFQYMPLDGYADNVNYIRLSGNFPYYHRNVFGLFKNYRVGYIDSLGNDKKILLPMFSPVIDTSIKKNKLPEGNEISKKEYRKEKRESYRSMVIDSSKTIATITLNTFSNGEGRHLRPFIKRSFRKIKKLHIQNLIVDLRNNGGGDVNISLLLTKYLRDSPFKIADSSYAIAKSFKPYTKYIKEGFINNIGMWFVTKKQKDGGYHFGFWERHLFYPKKKNHFNGNTYVLINGLTFSASTIFCSSVKGEKNITLVGEETGGGWYGNNGLLIPDIILPVTKLKVRLPFFRIIQFDHVVKNGHGVAPDIFIPPTIEGVKNGVDRKMEIVKDLIRKNY